MLTTMVLRRVIFQCVASAVILVLVLVVEPIRTLTGIDAAGPQLLDASWRKGSASRSVSGTVANPDRRTCRKVRVDVAFYDKTGTLLESSFDEVINLQPGGRWRFDVEAPADAATYQVLAVEAEY